MKNILKNIFIIFLLFSTFEYFASATKKITGRPVVKKKVVAIEKIVVPEKILILFEDPKQLFEWIDKQRPEGKAFLINGSESQNIIGAALSDEYLFIFNELMKRDLNVTIGLETMLNILLFDKKESDDPKIVQERIDKLIAKAIKQGKRSKEIAEIINRRSKELEEDYFFLPLMQKNNQLFSKAWKEAVVKNDRREKELLWIYLVDAVDRALENNPNNEYRVNLLNDVDLQMGWLKNEISPYAAEMIQAKIDQLRKKYGIGKE